MTPRHIANNLMDGPRIVAAVTRIGMLVFLGLTIIMWANNSWGKMELNFVFVFISFFGVLYTVVSPVLTVPWLGLYALSPTVAEEVKQVLLKLLFSFMLTATFLATWSFGASPWSFWALFALLLGLLTWQLVHKDAFGNITKKLQLGYLLVCIALVLLKTMGVDLGSKVDASTINSIATKASNLSFPDVSWGGSGAATSSASSNCPKDDPCPAQAGYEINLTADKSQTYRMSSVARNTGLEAKVTKPELRALVNDSMLFNVNQPVGSPVFTLQPLQAGFVEHVKGGVLHLKLYPLGQGDALVAKEYGVYTPPIDLTPGQ